MNLGECNSCNKALSLVSSVGAEGPFLRYFCAVGLLNVAYSLNRNPQGRKAEYVLPYATCWERSLGKLTSTHKEQTAERGAS